MDYSSLFLSNESIENAFKSNQQKVTRKGFASLVKSGTKKDFEKECEKCDFKTSTYNYMYVHNRIKHSDIKHKCTECNYTHAYPTKVRSHYKQVHLGVPKYKQKCRKESCKDVGTEDCKELQHFNIYCGQCEFSTKRNDTLKIHTKRVHEGLIESFLCKQCDFITNLKSSLKRHIAGKHLEETVHEKYKCDNDGCMYITLYKFKLRTHIETKHEGVVRFRCELMNCAFGTNERRQLKDHTRKHLKSENVENACKSYKCHACDKTFMAKRNLRTHIRNIHEGVGKFNCNYVGCPFRTYDKRSSEAHAMKHTGVKLHQSQQSLTKSGTSKKFTTM